jgi:predicted RNA binding protein YcfA (HicA-like mRNA interferase family)
MKVREVIRFIEADGWIHVRTTGSHRHYQHSRKPGTATVPGHANDELHPKTLKSIFKQAQLEHRP